MLLLFCFRWFIHVKYSKLGHNLHGAVCFTHMRVGLLNKKGMSVYLAKRLREEPRKLKTNSKLNQNFCLLITARCRATAPPHWNESTEMVSVSGASPLRFVQAHTTLRRPKGQKQRDCVSLLAWDCLGILPETERDFCFLPLTQNLTEEDQGVSF